MNNSVFLLLIRQVVLCTIDTSYLVGGIHVWVTSVVSFNSLHSVVLIRTNSVVFVHRTRQEFIVTNSSSKVRNLGHYEALQFHTMSQNSEKLNSSGVLLNHWRW